MFIINFDGNISIYLFLRLKNANECNLMSDERCMDTLDLRYSPSLFLPPPIRYALNFASRC